MRLIDADALIEETMERYCKDCERRKGVKNGKWKIVYSIGDAPCRACGIGDMIDELEDATTIEPERTGHWIECYPDGFWKCSACNFVSEASAADVLYKYCPNCGAKMEVERST